jgi:GT2 family glycosyltransferase
MTLPDVDRIFIDMNAIKPKSDNLSQLLKTEEVESELRDRIQTLERILHGELTKRSKLEFELHQIKNSLAWKILVDYRSLRDKLLADGTLRLTCYELLRDFCKVLLLKGRATDLNGRRLSQLTAKAFWTVRSDGLAALRRQLRNDIELKYESEGRAGLRRQLRNDIELRYEYWEWIERYDTLTDANRAAIRRHIDQLSYKPLISVVMPVYNTPEKWLRRAIESVSRQLYSNWELCIADDASVEPNITRILEEYSSNDSRIKVIFRKDNGHISAASNSAFEVAAGEFVAFLDHDDELSEHALYMVAVELNTNRDADLIYSDEDKIDQAGRRYDPYFKPDWNPALFLSQNFICHLAVYKTSIIRKIGGLRPGYEGAQDWDLALRVTERIPRTGIRHIPHVLYHWRAVAGSTAIAEDQKNYVKEAQRRTLQSHFERLMKKVDILPAADHYWRIKYRLSEPTPKVSIIIPTRNGFELLNRCLESIYQKTIYRNYELIVVDNQSDDPKLLDYLAQLERERRIRILRYDAPFNYAALSNFAVQKTDGEIVALLNNDLEVIAPDWLEEMVSYAIQPEIGAVGAMLYYPDNTIQHAGVILGIGSPPPGVAAHVYNKCPRGFRGQSSRALLSQNISAVTAACLAVRRGVFEEVGGLDDKNLPIAFNDIDFCLRVRESGYRNLWTPYAELYHYESASRGYEDTPEKLDRFEKEKQYMKKRWGSLLFNDPVYNPNLALGRAPFMLAFPPRITKPWLEVQSG